MYQTVEAEIGPDGVVTLHEAVRQPGRFLALVTNMTPLDDVLRQATQATWMERLWTHRTPISRLIEPMSKDEANQRS